jgi:hypothetical protein
MFRVFDYTLSDEESESVSQHNSGEHKNEDLPDCPVCQENDVNVIE